MTETDALIVGSGPAGVAAAFPLVEAGLRVRMVDVGKRPTIAPPGQPYKQFRTQDQGQWTQLLGRDYAALRADHAAAVSPKFRIPRLAYAFEGFADAYRLSSENSVISGSLAVGGLSNAWGAGVGCFDDADLEKFPIGKSDLQASYLRLADRIGLSGSADDDLSGFFGQDVPLSPATAVTPALQRVLEKYHFRRDPARQCGVTFGRSRHAVLTTPATSRNKCVECGQCLWGCAEKAIYNSAYDLERLLNYPAFEWMPDIFVEKIEVRDGRPHVLGRIGDGGEPVNMSARKILLACGAIGTGAIVLRSLQLESSIRLLSTPAAAFAAWLPASLGDAVPDRFFALGEIAFRVAALMPEESGYAFGAMFSTHGLPIAEFINRIPTSRRTALRISKFLLPSFAVGNCFFPGDLSDHRMVLMADDRIVVQGGFRGELDARVKDVRHRLAQSLRHYGAWMIPGTFTLGAAGADIHYAGTVPMRENPAPHESNRFGEVAGLPNVLVVDGAALSALPAKSHTFTMMANADRIAARVAQQLKAV